MANGIPSGGSGTFQAVLELNGSPFPSQPAFDWTTNVASAVVTPSADSLSVVISVPAGETATSITVTATVKGQSISGFLTVPLNAVVTPQVFTVVVSQSV